MIHVIKANGQKEVFSEEKVRYSTQRAGIPAELQDQVVAHIRSKLYEGIPTSEVYYHITEFLTNSNKKYEKARYSLKQAIMDLGPTGYPFEDFVADIFKAMGYTTQTRVTLAGKCITHEIDVLAEKEEKKTLIEAKFHNSSGTRSEIHVPMYMKSRFEDVKVKNTIDNVMIVTNTKATLDALAYSECMGIKIISWALPEAESLRDLIEKYNLHPITALTSLSQNQKQDLLNKHIVLCRDISANSAVLNDLHIPQERIDKILDEVAFVTTTSL